MTIVKYYYYSSKIVYSYNAFFERESIWIELQKNNELTNSIFY